MPVRFSVRCTVLTDLELAWAFFSPWDLASSSLGGVGKPSIVTTTRPIG